ncbi:long-chain fatty acid--CoA ligase [Sphingobacterium sp. SRCM116780]|uniref:AMP-dependent synthetase/ligase n=1 Tax=Sphingobacterium sp. SRCM116780 TaxID=2907623 RepID=UPI001F21A78A|nr:long-chain fatty acid--CoA ligase [Sphingobacterium sp. SRCM116780]UIR56622.1 long-chain fatty acid--CoA ligase [Sphingobacterium sp. SRCM116780]
MKQQTRIFDLITNYKTEHANKTIIAGRNKEGEWRTYSSIEFIDKINSLSKALLSIGLQKGDRIALMSGNRPEWSIVDFACNQLGIALVPLYPTLASQDLSFIINDAEAKLIFVSNEELSTRINVALKDNQLAIPIYTFETVNNYQNIASLYQIGEKLETDLKPFNDAVSENDLLTLIYTSGTTGKPKGVFLSHKNILSNVQACYPLIRSDFKKAISFLPLCHIFERMVVYMYYSKGVEIYFAENLDNIVVDINDVKPDLFTTVPRVLEKVYDKIVAKGKDLKGIKRSLFMWALDLGLRYQEPLKNSAWYNFQLSIARKLIFSKWQEALGGNIKIIVSGGAALQERLARVFWAAEMKVLEGYGLTETSPVIAVNTFEDTGIKFGTVGRPLKNLEVKIAQDGEILVKGPSVTSGYYKNDEATKETFDENGFFKTGDIGEISSDGFLKITDRKKEMFKTAGGKYIAPQAIENKLMESTFIGQIMVVGENRKFPAALIVPAFEEIEKWMKYKGISVVSKEDTIKNLQVIAKYNQEIERLSTEFGHWEKIKKFTLLPKEWTIDAGQLTPKLSLKRKVILKENESKIEDIYKESN